MSFVFGAAGIVLTLLALVCVGGLEVVRELGDRSASSRQTRRYLWIALALLTVLLAAQLVARVRHYT